jgi:hypothetical protein
MFKDSPAAGADILLTLFPGPVTLYRSRLKWVCMFVFFAVYVLCLTILLWPLLHRPPSLALMFLVGVIAVPALTLIMAITFGRSMPRLTLDAEGLELLQPWGARRLYWSEVTKFRSYMGLAFHVDVRPPKGSWDRFQRVYLGSRHRMWTETFGLGAMRFARLMNAWRERAIAQRR